MTNSKSTKRALVSSVLSVLICVAMLIGTTFAWFTDTASTSVNKIQAGNLDVALEVKEGGEWVSAEEKVLDFVKAEGHEGEAILWEPGCTYKLPELRIVNKGNLALKYKVVITGINGDAKLDEVIDWTIGDVAQGTEQHLAANEDAKFTISGTMNTEAGNEYQGLSIDGISITVYATQDTVEYDSNGNTYDGKATLDGIWDGKTTEVPEMDEEGVYHITSAAQFVDYIKTVQKGGNYKNAVLDCDIDLGNHTVEVSGEGYAFSGSFDGKNHTVSNYIIKRTDGKNYTGLFSCYDWTGASIKNLTVQNGTVISNGAQVSAIIPSLNDVNGVVDNCHAYNCTVIGEKKVGVITGYNANGTVSDCTATDCTVYASDNRENQATVFGYDNGGKFENNIANNVTVKTNIVAVSTANELAVSLNNSGNAPTNSRSIVLTANIDGSNWTAISAGSNYPAVTIDGNGHTITNLAQPLFSNLPARDFVFENINFTNVNIDSADNRGLGVIVGEGQANGGGSYTITNCHIKGGIIDGGDKYYVGGFIGFKSNGCNVKFANCSVTNLTLQTSEESVGAFAGHLYDTVTLTNCSVKGNTSVTNSVDRKGGDAKAGAFVGTVYSVNATNCSVDSTVKVSNNNAKAAINNAFFGRNAGGTITVK